MSNPIGAMNTKVHLIETVDQGPDGYAGLTEGSTAIRRTFWADVKEVSSNRAMDSGQQVSENRFKLKARYSPTAKIENGNYLNVDGKILVVTGWIVTDKNRFIEIMAEQRAEGGQPIVVVNSPTNVFTFRYGWSVTDPSANMSAATYQKSGTVDGTGRQVMDISTMPGEYYLYLEYPNTEADYTKYDMGYLINATIEDQTFKRLAQGAKKYVVTRDRQTFNASQITVKR